MIKKLSIGFAISISLFAFTACNSSSEESESDIPDVEASNVEITEVWTKGNPNATIVLTEYSDFQCPACGAYYPVVGLLVEEFKDDILFEYRHYPLRSIHKNANAAAQATEAAGIQGMFWEMHDMLFDEQRIWSVAKNPEDDFFEYAEELGLDVALFKADYESKAVRNKVETDFDSANEIGLYSTPSFLINGQLIDAPGSYEEFSGLIRSLIANG